MRTGGSTTARCEKVGGTAERVGGFKKVIGEVGAFICIVVYLDLAKLQD